MTEIHQPTNRGLMLTSPRCIPFADMEAQKQKGFQDPLCAVLNQNQRTLELPLVKPSAPEAPDHDGSPTPSLEQPNGNQGSEVGEPDRNDATDSSSAWSPEVLLPKLEGQT